MSVQASAWAWSVRDLPPHLKITLLAIADACNAEGYGYPGQERIAHQVQCSDRQIRSNVAALVKLGLIEVFHRPGDGSGRRSNAYQLRMEIRQATGSTLPEATGSPAQGQPEVQGGGNRKHEEGQPEVQTSYERQIRTSDRTSDTYRALRAPRAGGDTGSTPGFDAFWEAWPAGQRKRGRKTALAAWKTHHLEAQAAMIVADVRHRARHDEQWQRGFAPMPQTYLRGARWEDELAAPREEHRYSTTLAGIQGLEELKCQYRIPGSRKSSWPDSSDSPP